jgi:hypothetical protein
MFYLQGNQVLDELVVGDVAATNASASELLAAVLRETAATSADYSN